MGDWKRRDTKSEMESVLPAISVSPGHNPFTSSHMERDKN